MDRDYGAGVLALLILIVPIILASLKPHPFQARAAQHARTNGWSPPLILLTRSTCYLTLYSQAWVAAALLTKSPSVSFVAESLAIAVAIVYYAFNWINPLLLSWHDPEFTRAVVAIRPPLGNVFRLTAWIGLNLQHGVAPFLMYDFVERNALAHRGLDGLALLGAATVFFHEYHRFCWHVQGVPAYPFMEAVRALELESFLEIFGVAFVVAVGLGVSASH